MSSDLRQVVSEAMCSVFAAEGLVASVRPSEEYAEVFVKSPVPITTDHMESVERLLADRYRVKMLGVSGVTGGYRMWGKVFETLAELDEFTGRAVGMLSHKDLGTKMQLFYFQDESPGEVFFLDRGLVLRERLKGYLAHVISQHYQRDQYRFVETPAVVSKTLWERSGHMENFAGNMQFVDEHYALKPMNCPCHILMYKHKTRSYREMPVRLLEYGKVYRNEPSGALNGMFRLKSFVQDDGHIFCTMQQIQHEVELFVSQTYQVYHGLGFTKIKTYLATRPDNYAGDRAEWDQAEEMLRRVGAEEAPGEGAFYGPKIEFHLEDARGRCWQCGTVQLDFVLPARMEMEYIDASAQPLKPVILHRAILGSLERFVAILLESTQGWLPFWLAPVQVMIVPVGERHLARATELCERLCVAGVRAVLGEAECVGKQVKAARIQRIQRVWLIGDKEADCVSERDLHRDTEHTMHDDQAVEMLVALGQFPTQ